MLGSMFIVNQAGFAPTHPIILSIETFTNYKHVLCVHADIDECVSLNETCLDENTHCVNSVGNFSCQCDPGFTGNGYNCSS